MRTMTRTTASIGVAALLAATSALAQSGDPVEQGPPNVPGFEPAFPAQTRAPAVETGITLEREVIAAGLEHPWGLAVLPSGDYLVTERAGRMRVIFADAQLSDPIAGIPEVLNQRQGGLLDVAAGPDFLRDRMIYWTYSKPMGAGMSATAAARGRLSEDMSEVTAVEDIFVQQPPSPTAAHYGARIDFDGDGHVFITTGEHFTRAERQLAQDLDTTYGKIIRLNLDGSVPEDNPFIDEPGAIPSVWSYGHRNVQGIDFHPENGALWAGEHGPKGGDELNIIEPGVNYGWPVISYGENYDGSPVGTGTSKAEGMAQPVYYWDPVIAPSGMTFYDAGPVDEAMFEAWRNDLLIGSLTPGGIVHVEIEGERVTGEERLIPDAGRIRDVIVAPDGALLALIDDADGSVLRLTPKQ